MKVAVISGGISGLTACYNYENYQTYRLSYDMKENWFSKNIKYKKENMLDYIVNILETFNSKYNNLFSILKI